MITGTPTEFGSDADYRREKGIPKEKTTVQMDFFRGAYNPALMTTIAEGNLDSFYEAPMQVRDSTLTKVIETVSTPQVKQVEETGPKAPPATAVPSPCCGAKMENLSRSRVRCTGCGAEYTDSQA